MAKKLLTWGDLEMSLVGVRACTDHCGLADAVFPRNQGPDEAGAGCVGILQLRGPYHFPSIPYSTLSFALFELER